MPYIFAKAWFPSDKIMEVVAKVPDAVKILRKGKADELGDIVIQNAVRATKDGVVSISVTKTKPGKFDEALALAQKHWMVYGMIPGLEYELKVWATAEEAFGAIDMKPPEA
jgi:hypothetical protein